MSLSLIKPSFLKRKNRNPTANCKKSTSSCPYFKRWHKRQTRAYSLIENGQHDQCYEQFIKKSDHYNETEFNDDFMHIITFHTNTESMQMKNTCNKPCNIKTCLSVDVNYRDPNIHNNTMFLHNNREENVNFCRQKIFIEDRHLQHDSIFHNHKSQDEIRSIRNRHPYSGKLARRFIDNQQDEEKMYDNDTDDINGNGLTIYKAGELMNYKNKHSSRYIWNKYKDLKSEWLAFFNINVETWDEKIRRAKGKSKSKFIKQLISNDGQDKSISPVRILVIWEYTSNDYFQLILCKISRKTRKDCNGSHSKLKKEHGEFGHTFKLLTETIEKFGSNMRNDKQYQILYRGLGVKQLNSNAAFVEKEHTKIAKKYKRNNLKKSMFATDMIDDELTNSIINFKALCNINDRIITKQERIKLSNIISEEVNDDSGYNKQISIINKIISDKLKSFSSRKRIKHNKFNDNDNGVYSFGHGYEHLMHQKKEYENIKLHATNPTIQRYISNKTSDNNSNQFIKYTLALQHFIKEISIKNIPLQFDYWVTDQTMKQPFLPIDSIEIMDLKTRTKIINSTSWCNINVFRNLNATKMTGLSMNKSVFISNISKCNNNNLVPITAFDNDSYIWIVKISQDVHIGISLKYIQQTNDFKVMDIYLDKQQIQNQLVISNHTYNDLDNFNNDNIYTLIINEDNTQYFKPCKSYESELYSETESEDWEDDETDSELDEKLDDIDIKRDTEFYC